MEAFFESDSGPTICGADTLQLCFNHTGMTCSTGNLGVAKISRGWIFFKCVVALCYFLFPLLNYIRCVRELL